MRRLTPVLLLGLLITGNIIAQVPLRPHLSDYVGTYADEPGHTVEIVAGDEFFAVQDEAKYLLRPLVSMSSPPLLDKRSRSAAMHAVW